MSTTARVRSVIVRSSLVLCLALLAIVCGWGNAVVCGIFTHYKDSALLRCDSWPQDVYCGVYTGTGSRFIAVLRKWTDPISIEKQRVSRARFYSNDSICSEYSRLALSPDVITEEQLGWPIPCASWQIRRISDDPTVPGEVVNGAVWGSTRFIDTESSVLLGYWNSAYCSWRLPLKVNFVNAMLCGALSLAALWLIARLARQACRHLIRLIRAWRGGQCLACGYSNHGLSVERCPECGEPCRVTRRP
jgi:hypothetical protein